LAAGLFGRRRPAHPSATSEPTPKTAHQNASLKHDRDRPINNRLTVRFRSFADSTQSRIAVSPSRIKPSICGRCQERSLLLVSTALSLFNVLVRARKTCCGSEPCERRDGARLKNVAERGDRGVGDRDPRRASTGRVPWSDVFPRRRAVRRAACFLARILESDKVALAAFSVVYSGRPPGSMCRSSRSRVRETCCTRDRFQWKDPACFTKNLAAFVHESSTRARSEQPCRVAEMQSYLGRCALRSWLCTRLRRRLICSLVPSSRKR
jgi:hypothetical protein